jgi:hypothetical protein
MHLREMAAHGVFPMVAGEVRAEIMEAQSALQEWRQLAPTALLLGLCDMLQAQLAELQAPVAG